jgi:peptidoglycan/xylan/chitin deacetylase (PgdA/CDA1 family)
MAIFGRNVPYLVSRSRSVGARYGVTSVRAKDRVQRCIGTLEPHGLLPTFATPGRVIEEEPSFFRRLSDDGAEFAVHGYDHVDFRKISRDEATSQFARALEAYRRAGVACDGFRCPYLSFTPELVGTWPEGAFSYSSNRAVAWRAAALDADNPVFAQLAKFYAAVSADEEVSLPSTMGAVVEIPCSVPDDLELFDGLSLGEQGMLDAWLDVLHEVHRRGELFAPLFHPESFDLMQGPIEDLLDAAARLEPAVWLTQLRDVAQWWQEKRAFTARASTHTGGLRIELHCTERATVLVRDWPPPADTRPWDGTWSVLDARTVEVAAPIRPFIGVDGVDDETVAFLTELGYVLDDGPTAHECTLVLDGAVRSPVQLIRRIEDSEGPLLRFSNWPSETRCALCLAGDLDALSLRDYARRLVPHRQ